MSTSNLYKSTSYYMNVSTRGFGLLKFVNHSLLVDQKNAKLVKYIEEDLIPNNPSLGLYIDEAEKTVDTTKLNPTMQSQAEYEAYLASKGSQFLGDMGSDEGKNNLGATSAVEAQGKTGAADSARFSAQDILRKKIAERTAAGQNGAVDTDAIARAANPVTPPQS